jgi:hypothetical protein
MKNHNQRRNLLLLLLLFVQAATLDAQTAISYAFVDSISRHIPDSLTHSTKTLGEHIDFRFNKDHDKLRAIYTWVTHNIQYDFEDTTEMIYDDELENYVQKTLITRKGKCQGFAELFHELCQISGLNSFVVSGLVKTDKEAILETHAWNAALDSSNWKLFDLTFGAGYEIDNAYIQEFDGTYCDINPSLLIETHYPFDPIWQLSDQPISFISFMDTIKHKNKPEQYFNFSDSIKHFLSLNQYEQLKSSKKRIFEFKNHTHNKHIEHWLKNVDQQIELLTYNEMITTYNQCRQDFNDASNDFIKWVNSSDINSLSSNTSEDSIAFLNQLNYKLTSSKTLLQNLAPNEENLVFNIILLKHEISRLLSRISECKNNIQNSF